ncbi:sensor domain-containing diguanylate cyclase [Chitinimonas naiadis]
MPRRLLQSLYADLPRNTRLAMAGVLTLILVLTAALGWWLVTGYDSAQQKAAVNAYNTARLLEERVLGTSREVDLMLKDVAHEAERLPVNPPVSWSEPIGFEAIMLLREKAERLPHMAAVTVLDAEGRVAYSTAANLRVSFSDLPYIQNLLRAPKPGLVISAPYTLRTTGRLGVVFARPVFSAEGRLRAVVVAGMHIEAWSRHFADIELGQHGSVAVVDAERHLVARQPLPDRKLIGRQFEQLVWQPTKLLQDTYFYNSPIDGERRLLAVRQVPGYPFLIGVGASEIDYLSDWRAGLVVTLLGLALLLILGVGLLVLLWRAGQQARALAESEARLIAREQRMRSMLEASPCALGVVEYGPDRIRYANPDMAALFGLPLASLAGLQVVELFVRPEEWKALSGALRDAGTLREMEFALRCGDGVERWVAVSATLLGSNGEDSSEDMLLSLVDVTARHARETRLTEEASTDALTGLANRRRFFERGGELFELARRHHRPMSLLMLDLDHFKLVNDTHGHAVGDEVLVRIARLLETSRRQGDLPARLGGEEFVVLVPETALPQAIEAAERIREAVENAPLTLEDGTLVPVTVSVGVAELRPTDTELHLLLIAADAALYRAKDAGRNRVVADVSVGEKMS